MTILAYVTLLHRYENSEDLVVFRLVKVRVPLNYRFNLRTAAIIHPTSWDLHPSLLATILAFRLYIFYSIYYVYIL
jgi:hypothetical protein